MRKPRKSYKSQQRTFPNTEIKQRIRELICERAQENLPHVGRILTFPGETPHNITTVAGYFPDAEIVGVEVSKSVSDQCHYGNYGVNYTHFHGKLSSFVEQPMAPFDVAWLDHWCNDPLEDQVREFVAKFMRRPSVLAITLFGHEGLGEHVASVEAAYGAKMLDAFCYETPSKLQFLQFLLI